MYVEAFVNGKPTKAMVDMGFTHNFVSLKEAKRLKLHAFKRGQTKDYFCDSIWLLWVLINAF